MKRSEKLIAVAGHMVAAADMLDIFSALYDAESPANYPWTANQLRHEATVLTKNALEAQA